MTWHRDNEGKRQFGFLDILWIAGIAGLVALVVYLLIFPADASHGTGFAPCRNDGLWDSQDNVPYSPELFEMCGAPYYDAYIEGCMSLNNTREVCEAITEIK